MALSDWDESELMELSNLTMPGGPESMTGRQKVQHLICLYEIAPRVTMIYV